MFIKALLLLSVVYSLSAVSFKFGNFNFGKNQQISKEAMTIKDTSSLNTFENKLATFSDTVKRNERLAAFSGYMLVGLVTYGALETAAGILKLIVKSEPLVIAIISAGVFLL